MENYPNLKCFETSSETIPLVCRKRYQKSKHNYASNQFWAILENCKFDLCNVYIELHRVCTEVKMTLEQEIIELVRFSATKSVGDVSFSSS